MQNTSSAVRNASLPLGIVFALGATPLAAQQPNARLVDQGFRLFTQETFAGNGRTCATCHRPERNFTIDPEFIATLPPDDPLFVHEFTPGLETLEVGEVLRSQALVCENLDNFDRPCVMRGVPHTFGLPTSIQIDTAPDSNQRFADGTQPVHALGWSADGSAGDGSLRSFAIGAVIQHFPKTLDRIEGVDFRLPTEAELDALEAFQLSLGRQEEIDLAALSFADEAAQRGKDLFLGVGLDRACTACHENAGANDDAGINVNRGTNVNRLTTEFPPDGGFGREATAGVAGFGNGRFNTAPLIEAADTAPFFHNNSAATLEDAIRFYTTTTFADPLDPDPGSRPFVLDEQQIADMAAMLRALNAMDNASIASAGLVAALRRRSDDMTAVQADIDDGIEVLAASNLSPAAVAEFEFASALVTFGDFIGARRILLGIPELVATEEPSVAEPEPTAPAPVGSDTQVAAQ